MKKLIVILIFFVGNNVSNGQIVIDSISMKKIPLAKTLEDLNYEIPEPIDVIHFLIVCNYSKIDPVVSYNSGPTLCDKSLLFLSRLQTGDTLEVQEIYGMKPGSINKSEFRMPDRKFIVSK